jgi:hypothetical protein
MKYQFVFFLAIIASYAGNIGWDVSPNGGNIGWDQSDTVTTGASDTDTVIVSYLSKSSTNNSYSVICSLFTDTGGIIRLSDSAATVWTQRDSSGWRTRGGFRDTLSRSGLTQDIKYYYRLIAEDSANHFDTIAIDSIVTLRNIPIISYSSSTCSTDISFSIDVSSTGGTPDSIVCTSTLPSGLTCTKTGANIGRISGTCNLVASVARADYQVIAYNNGGNDTAQLSLAVILNPQIWVDHRHVALYSIIPQEWIDSVMKMQINIPGESHGAGYLYGLELLDSLDNRFVYKDSWATGPISPTTPDSLRGLRIWRRNGSWTNGAGEEDWYTSPDSIARMNRHFKYCNDTLLNRIHVALFGWCWDMTWHNAPEDGRADTDDVYGCRWAGSSIGGPQGDSGWGLDNGDTALTGNTVTLQKYLDATDYYGAQNPLTKIVFTTGPADNLTADENGYQRELKQQAIRSHVRDSSGRALFDYSDILSYNNADIQYVNLTGWTDFNDVFHTYPTIQAVNKGDYERNGHLSCHLSDTGVIRIGKAELFLLARVAGWSGDTTYQCDISSITKTGFSVGFIASEPCSIYTAYYQEGTVIDTSKDTCIYNKSIAIIGLCFDSSYTVKSWTSTNYDTAFDTIRTLEMPQRSFTWYDDSAFRKSFRIIPANCDSQRYSAPAITSPVCSLYTWNSTGDTSTDTISTTNYLTRIGSVPGYYIWSMFIPAAKMNYPSGYTTKRVVMRGANVRRDYIIINKAL